MKFLWASSEWGEENRLPALRGVKRRPLGPSVVWLANVRGSVREVVASAQLPPCEMLVDGESTLRSPSLAVGTA